MKKIFLIAGEASGDSHGAHLIHELKQMDPSLEFFGFGGNKMLSTGAQINTELTHISAVGLTDVLANYFTYRRIFYNALRWADEIQPDVIILIDYPGFNLRFAKKINRKFPIIYYISPQIWAWGGRRIKVIKKFISKLLVFFPFEKKLYDSASVPCAYIGHPLTDEIPSMPGQGARQVRTIGLLPGSRKKEVKRILPALLEAALLIKQKHPDIQFILSESDNIPQSMYEEISISYKQKLPITVLRGKSYEAIKKSDLLIVASGTATLETALHEKPFILVYKAAWLTYFLGRLLIQIKFLGIANILSGKRVVPELIQTEMTPKKISEEIGKLIDSADERKNQILAFQEIRKQLSVGNSAQLAAKEILAFVRSYAKATAPSKNI